MSEISLFRISNKVIFTKKNEKAVKLPKRQVSGRFFFFRAETGGKWGETSALNPPCQTFRCRQGTSPCRCSHLSVSCSWRCQWASLVTSALVFSKVFFWKRQDDDGRKYMKIIYHFGTYNLIHLYNIYMFVFCEAVNSSGGFNIETSGSPCPGRAGSRCFWWTAFANPWTNGATALRIKGGPLGEVELFVWSFQALGNVPFLGGECQKVCCGCCEIVLCGMCSILCTFTLLWMCVFLASAMNLMLWWTFEKIWLLQHFLQFLGGFSWQAQWSRHFFIPFTVFAESILFCGAVFGADGALQRYKTVAGLRNGCRAVMFGCVCAILFFVVVWRCCVLSICRRCSIFAAFYTRFCCGTNSPQHCSPNSKCA